MQGRWQHDVAMQVEESQYRAGPLRDGDSERHRVCYEGRSIKWYYDMPVHGNLPLAPAAMSAPPRH